MFCQNFWFRFLTTILLFGWQIFLFAQTEFRAQMYTLKDGLSSEYCRSMYRDKAGFLWISSDKGLNRFDGNSFYTFRHRPEDIHSIANNSCNGILEDSKGRFWINTDDGLSLFDRKNKHFRIFIQTPPSYRLRVLVIRIWLKIIREISGSVVTTMF